MIKILYHFQLEETKTLSLTEFYDLSYEYKNDCLIAYIYIYITDIFYKDDDLVPSENYFLRSL